MATHANKLDQIVSLIVESANNPDTEKFKSIVCEKTSLPAEAIKAVIDGLASLRAFMDHLKVKADKLVAYIDNAIETQASPAWAKEHLKKWQSARPKIVAALDSLPSESCLSLQQKVKELTYAHEHVLTDARLITDLRPVFNAVGDDIKAVVLTHVLSISYFDGSQRKRIEFALDVADLGQLRKIAERAYRKMATAKKRFESSGIPLIEAGSVKQDAEPSEDSRRNQ